MKVRVHAAVLLAAVLAACASTTTTVAPSDRPPVPLSPAVAALSGPGPVAVRVTAGSMPGTHGCAVAWESYDPAAAETGVTVFLAHGFQRNLTFMRGWARAWASRGVRTVIMSFCNSSLVAGRHDWNAEDLRALAAATSSGPVLYAGFSAGGLAALLAAADDPRAVALLGLDPVDSGRLAPAAAARLPVPALFVMGDPADCNARGNMAPVVAAARTIAAVRVNATVHCMFEDPSDAGCAALCGSVAPAEVAGESTTVLRALATAWILQAAGVPAGGSAVLEDLWKGGDQWTKRVTVLKAGT